MRPTKALAYAILIWLVGFVWGSVVFVTPSLKSVSPIPYISSNPAISFPILLIWIPLTYLFARSCLKGSSNKSAAGLRLGFIFSVTDVALDLVVLVFILRAGFGYFASLTVWLGYTILLIIPWLTGRSWRKSITS